MSALATAGTSIRILLVDDHAVLRTGLRLLIQQTPNMVVVGEASNQEEALLLAASEEPDIILLELALGHEADVENLPLLLATARHTRLVILTGLRNPDLHRAAIMRGAMGLVLKSEPAAHVLTAIEKVYAGEACLSPTITANVLAAVWGSASANMAAPLDTAAPLDKDCINLNKLTPREQEITALVCQGLKNKDLAHQLLISEATVRHHLTSIYAKLCLADRVGLVIFAFRHGLARP